MKSIFETSARQELVDRINALDVDSPAQWGKMNVAQMMRHCAKWDEMALGKVEYKQSLLGKLVGKFALKNMMKDKPVKKNLPSVPSFIMTGSFDFLQEKANWIALIKEYEHATTDGFIHPFFGKLTKEIAGQMAYKHDDHHLRQFNV